RVQRIEQEVGLELRLEHLELRPRQIGLEPRGGDLLFLQAPEAVVGVRRRDDRAVDEQVRLEAADQVAGELGEEAMGEEPGRGGQPHVRRSPGKRRLARTTTGSSASQSSQEKASETSRLQGTGWSIDR